jgi:hypothetical protein
MRRTLVSCASALVTVARSMIRVIVIRAAAQSYSSCSSYNSPSLSWKAVGRETACRRCNIDFHLFTDLLTFLCMRVCLCVCVSLSFLFVYCFIYLCIYLCIYYCNRLRAGCSNFLALRCPTCLSVSVINSTYSNSPSSPCVHNSYTNPKGSSSLCTTLIALLIVLIRIAL